MLWKVQIPLKMIQCERLGRAMDNKKTGMQGMEYAQANAKNQSQEEDDYCLDGKGKLRNGD